MIICPSCGSNVEGNLCLGCPACGARAVGPPLAKAEYELPSYGRATLTFVAGGAMTVAFLGLVIATLFQNGNFTVNVERLLNAGQIAAWQIKWVALPVAIIVLWGAAGLVGSIKKNPTRFAGLRAGRVGLASALVATLMIASLIGMTVPERLRRHGWALQAGSDARDYTLVRAMNEYRELHGSVPSDPDELVKELRTLPDPDGSIARALQGLDAGGYKPGAVVAAASTKSKPQVLRTSALRNAETRGVQPLTQPLTFNTYELRTPGPDKVINTDDDSIIRDGIILRVSDLPPTSVTVQPRSKTP